jgi:cyclase
MTLLCNRDTDRNSNMSTTYWKRGGITGFILCALMSMATSAVAQQRDWEQETFSTTKVRPGLYMLSGAGGNLALSVGRDGVLLVDDDMTPMAGKLQAAIAELTKKPVRFVLNTHWHFDHVGGNAALGASGSVIVAHQRVRERMAEGQYSTTFQMDISPAEPIALPLLTFEQGLAFHFNDDTVEVEHAPAAHTDGDSLVYFAASNVVHTGDLYWNGIYPLVDVESGGRMLGVIEGVAAILARIDDETKVIPGHGPLSDKAAMQAYHDMMKTVFERVRTHKSRGMSVDEVIAAKPTAEFDEHWGKGLFSPEQWVQLIYGAI